MFCCSIECSRCTDTVVPPIRSLYTLCCTARSLHRYDHSPAHVGRTHQRVCSTDTVALPKRSFCCSSAHPGCTNMVAPPIRSLYMFRSLFRSLLLHRYGRSADTVEAAGLGRTGTLCSCRSSLYAVFVPVALPLQVLSTRVYKLDHSNCSSDLINPVALTLVRVWLRGRSLLVVSQCCTPPALAPVLPDVCQWSSSNRDRCLLKASIVSAFVNPPASNLALGTQATSSSFSLISSRM